MKVIFCSTFFLLMSTLLLGQSSKIDSLIRHLNNTEIRLDGNDFGRTYFIENGPGSELLGIGKPATEQLLNALTDSAKGVIAHLVLTHIWKDSVRWISPIYIEKDGITVFTVNELPFFIKGTDVYANAFDLKKVFNLWSAFLPKQAVRDDKFFKAEIRQ